MEVDSLHIFHKSKVVEGHIDLEGSKSISNRLLIIQALCPSPINITGLSTSADTEVLKDALSIGGDEYDVGHAGTSFRFLTAYLAFQKDTQMLTGSDRMKERPIGPLVDALNEIGASITYLEKEGYPPLKIAGPSTELKSTVTIDASTSSQFISALCLLAPTLPNGLQIEMEGDMVSSSYIKMTLEIMASFGIEYTWEENKITVLQQSYQGMDYTVEADWSSASYFYILASLSAKANITISGLFENSLQGDSIIRTLGEQLGVTSTFDQGNLVLQKSVDPPSPMIENNFINHPDIAQTLFCICAGHGTSGLFTGLQTLKIKETDRIAAMKKELGRLNVSLATLPTQKFSKKTQVAYYMQQGKADFKDAIEIETYNDHRMAMSFGALSILGALNIKDAEVVKKSYPNFWNDLSELGFEITYPS